MNAIRPTAVADLFYPADPAVLQDMVEGFLREFAENEGNRQSPEPALRNAIPKALIAPHAGFIYSGSIAASAYGRLVRTNARTRIRRVVLLGPSHHVGFRGLAVTGADFFHTPMGDIPVDRAAVAKLADFPQVGILDQAHAREHSLEVHLPFLVEVLDDFMLVPLVVGETEPEQVAEVLERLWDADTLIVVSTDLSHYLEYEEARQRDNITAHAIETLDTGAIGGGDACGRNPINGLLHLAKQRGMVVERLDLRNSGDTAGDKRRVVGYGAWAFFEREKATSSEHAEFSTEERETLLRVARDSIAHGLAHNAPSPIDSSAFSASLREKRATFVTLEKGGQLRGCIGSLRATHSLVEDIAKNAFNAAFEDPRFPGLGQEEQGDITIKLSLLTPPEAMRFQSEADLIAQLRPGVDGLILTAGPRRATFLPAVWESLPEPTQFLRHLKQKAGLAPDAWPENIAFSRYVAQQIGE
uniref:MEMO1 family protein BECKMB1821H_GA0114242_10781 n=1 Tax=Candidatus Kentrum sp. MB TaxID=2138164 RepID=A0A451BEX3_9GAMM|nr:MAG: hypothetical protein BECKMB1821I_GA0114274_10781 [Candidatus Kentron sp. MB]VFK76831.1 MAG: hypothetical protein BECKMB1821H_GA0114242_10781 [Candidatus Kentron sp. MB]